MLCEYMYSYSDALLIVGHISSHVWAVAITDTRAAFVFLVRLSEYLFPRFKMARNDSRSFAFIARSRVLHGALDTVPSVTMTHKEADEYAFLISSGDGLLHPVA